MPNESAKEFEAPGRQTWQLLIAMPRSSREQVRFEGSASDKTAGVLVPRELGFGAPSRCFRQGAPNMVKQGGQGSGFPPNRTAT